MSGALRRKPSGFWIGIAINLAIGLLLVAVTLAAAWRENQAAQLTARERVEAVVAEFRANSGRIANDYGWWDESARRLLDHDAQWADEYIGDWLGNTADLAFAVAVGPDDEMLFQWPEGVPRDVAPLAGLLKQIRALPSDRPRAVTAFRRMGGRTMLLAASILRPRESPGAPMTAVLVFGWDVEATMLPRLRATTRLPGVDFATGRGPSLALADEAGVEVARVGWRPRQPGSEFIAWVLPATGATLAVLSLIAWRYWARARKHWQALLAADDTRVRLLAAISHDLRQPLQSLSLFATVLEAEAGSERAMKAVTALKASVERMADLLEATLKLARLDMRLGGAETRSVVLDDVLAPLVREMSPQAEAKGLSLRYVPSRVAVLSDPVLLGTMVRNLVSNALRYTERGGVLVGCRRRRGGPEIWVCDTGIGIPPDQRSLIFEEFYQVANRARDYRQGVGLGLAIVDRLARMLGHRVSLDSREGRGSRFAIRLKPAAPVTPWR